MRQTCKPYHRQTSNKNGLNLGLNLDLDFTPNSYEKCNENILNTTFVSII